MTYPPGSGPTRDNVPNGFPAAPTTPIRPSSIPPGVPPAMPPRTLVYPAVPTSAPGRPATGRVELAPGFAPPGAPPMYGPSPWASPGVDPAPPKPRRSSTVMWIGLAAVVLVAALVLAFVFQPRADESATVPATGPTTGLPTTQLPSTGVPPSTSAASHGGTTSPDTAPSTGEATPSTGDAAPTTGAAVPADPGWPPSRIPTSLLPRSGAPDTDDPAGGVVAARQRVAGFVRALNDDDPDAANTFLCTAMVGAFGDDMLTGIEPGSVGVGGVTVSGSTGAAYITFRPIGGGDPEQSEFGLVVEGGQWMVCRAP